MRGHEFQPDVAATLATITALGFVGCANTGEQAPTPSISKSVDTSDEATPTATSSPSETPSMDVSSSPTAIETPTGIKTTETASPEKFQLYDWSKIDEAAFERWDSLTMEEKDQLASQTFELYQPGSALVYNDMFPDTPEILKAFEGQLKVVQDAYNDGEYELVKKLIEAMVGHDDIDADHRAELMADLERFGAYTVEEPGCLQDPGCVPYVTRGIGGEILYTTGEDANYEDKYRPDSIKRALTFVPSDPVKEFDGFGLPASHRVTSVYFRLDPAGDGAPPWRVDGVYQGTDWLMDYGDGSGPQVVGEVPEVANRIAELDS